MTRNLRGSTLIAVALVVTCADDAGADVLGVWKVASHTFNTAACDAEGPKVEGVPYLKIAIESFARMSVRTVRGCSDATGSSCTGGGFFSFWYRAPIRRGYRAEITDASGDAESCFLDYSESTMVLEPDDTLKIETRTYEVEVITGTDAECDERLANARKTTMPCVNFESTTATRVVPP